MPQSLTRFRRHAAFVRVLCIQHPSDIHPDLFGYLEGSGIHAPLLPSLETLVFERSPANTPLLALWVIGPSLRSFTYSLYNPGFGGYTWLPELVQSEIRVLQTVLAKLRSSSPGLEDLHLVDEVLEFDPKFSLQFTNLRSLDLEAAACCDTSFLRALATLPHLHSLYVPREVIGKARPVPFGFAHLKFLQVYGGPASMRCALETINPPSLRHLSLTMSFRHESVVFQVVGSLSERCSATLAHLSVRYVSFDSNARKVSDALAPLFCMRKLRALTVRSTPGPLQCTDADLAALARHWPRLQSLHLECKAKGELPTAQGIAHLREACPDLSDVSLRLDKMG